MTVDQLIAALSEFPGYYSVSMRVETESEWDRAPFDVGAPVESADVEQDCLHGGGIKVILR